VLTVVLAYVAVTETRLAHDEVVAFGVSTTTRYLNIQRRGLLLAMEKLEESQRLAREGRAEERRRASAEAMARSCHTSDANTPAPVSDFAQLSSPNPGAHLSCRTQRERNTDGNGRA
jgi:hypothetical protein